MKTKITASMVNIIYYAFDDRTEFVRKQREGIINGVISDKPEVARQSCHKDAEQPS